MERQIMQITAQLLNDRYELQDALGKGLGGNRTYRALDRHTGQTVVIKLLQFGPGFEWEQLKLFEREAQILQTLDHPNIPRYLDSFDINHQDYKGFALVQTYIEALSLEEQLTHGRAFSIEEVKQVAEQLLTILTCLHQHSPPIIHRDLKPSNILLGDRTAHRVGEIYLVDFGSVQNLVATKGSTITVVGTYGYMPPEQFGGRAVPASDLYSLGATLVYLLSGLHPADLPQRDLRLSFEKHIPNDRALHRWLRSLLEPALDKRTDSAAKALMSLQQKPELLDLAQGCPAGSSIRLRDSGDRLSIRFPNPSLYKPIQLPPISGWGCLIAFAMSWAWMAWMGIAFGSKLLLGLLSMMLEKELVISDQSIHMTYHFLNLALPLGQKRNRRHEITHIELITAHERKNQWFTEGLPAEIIIWAGNHDYRIKLLGGLTTPEIAWLTQELADWLGVEVSNRKLLLLDAKTDSIKE